MSTSLPCQRVLDALQDCQRKHTRGSEVIARVCRSDWLCPTQGAVLWVWARQSPRRWVHAVTQPPPQQSTSPPATPFYVPPMVGRLCAGRCTRVRAGACLAPCARPKVCLSAEVATAGRCLWIACAPTHTTYLLARFRVALSINYPPHPHTLETQKRRSGSGRGVCRRARRPWRWWWDGDPARRCAQTLSGGGGCVGPLLGSTAAGVETHSKVACLDQRQHMY